MKIAGAPNNPVILTSLVDDSIGGDTNGDGGVTSPRLGDWNSISVFALGVVVNIDYAQIKYGGGAAFLVGVIKTPPALNNDNPISVIINHSSIINNFLLVISLSCSPLLRWATASHWVCEKLCIVCNLFDLGGGGGMAGAMSPEAMIVPPDFVTYQYQYVGMTSY